MKVLSVTKREMPGNPVEVRDCAVGEGYLKVAHGSLPDIDSDFNAERIDEVKAYLQQRYNKDGQQRVFLAGTFTTAKIRSVIKDVARTYKIPQSTTNYLTAMFKDDKMTWTDLMRMAATEKRVRDYIQRYPEVFEEILPIMFQPRAAGIHASATIIIPEYIKGKKVECFDLLPIRKMGDMLVSEISGDDIDKIGILKNDVLSIKELTRLSDMFDILRNDFGKELTMLEIITKYLDEKEVFDMISEGKTQGLFQINGAGMTKFMKRMKPDNIHDLIASVALYRPGPLNSGATDNYVRAKRGEYEPSYLWGTYNALARTYAQICYQEQVSQIAREVGSLSISDSVGLVKALSKKKLKDVLAYRDKFFAGAKANGCPPDAAREIWSNVEDAAKYAFNMAHATAYGLTAYIGAWIKTHYPTAFYTVALKDQDEDKMSVLINEIDSMGGVSLEHPDINISGDDFVADFAENKIYWSLSRVKQLGPKAVAYIEQERKLYGKFDNLEDFIKRIFRNKFREEGVSEGSDRCPVTARSVRNLILTGAFDNCENAKSVLDRYEMMFKASVLLEFDMVACGITKELAPQHHFWSRQQILLSGHGSIDYRRICENVERPKGAKSSKYVEFRELNDRFLALKRGVICASIVSVSDKSYKDRNTGETKHFGKIELQQNTENNVLTIWDEWRHLKKQLKDTVGSIIIASVSIRWSDYDEKNVLSLDKNSFLKLI